MILEFCDIDNCILKDRILGKKRYFFKSIIIRYWLERMIFICKYNSLGIEVIIFRFFLNIDMLVGWFVVILDRILEFVCWKLGDCVGLFWIL